MEVIKDELIKHLRKQLSNHSEITVNQLHLLMEEYFDKNRKNCEEPTILDSLKKNVVIQDVPRGHYAVREKDEENRELYVVITLDIVNSSREDYKRFEKSLLEKVELLNSAIENTFEIKSNYRISRGDEIQAVLPFRDTIGKIILLTMSLLQPYEIRYGISIGYIEEPILEDSWKMNGPLFWTARDMLEQVKNEDRYSGMIASGEKWKDKIIHEILKLIHSTIRRITRKQWEAIALDLSGMGFEEAIERLSISKTSYYERLRASNMEDILSSFRGLYQLLSSQEV